MHEQEDDPLGPRSEMWLALRQRIGGCSSQIMERQRAKATRRTLQTLTSGKSNPSGHWETLDKSAEGFHSGIVLISFFSATEAVARTITVDE